VHYSASEKFGNAVAVYNDMKQFFPRTGSGKTETPKENKFMNT